MWDLETFFACVIGFRCFCLDNYRSVSTMKVLAFVRDYSGDVARGQTETRSECGQCSDHHGNYDLQNEFCFVRHSAYFLKFGAKVLLFFDICKRKVIFFYILLYLGARKLLYKGDMRPAMAGGRPQWIASTMAGGFWRG